MTNSPIETYAVADWKSRFENSRSREVKSLTWHQMPVLLADPIFAQIVTEDGGAAIFGAFVSLVQVAAQGNPRGTITLPNGKPHTAKSLALLTRMPVELIETTLRVTSELGWLLSLPEAADEVPTSCRSSADVLPTMCSQDRPKERHKDRQKETGISRFSESENEEFQTIAGRIFRRHPAERRGGSEQVFIQDLIAHLENDAEPLRTLRAIERGHESAARSRNWQEGFAPKLGPWVKSGDWQNADEFGAPVGPMLEETPPYVPEEAA